MQGKITFITKRIDHHIVDDRIEVINTIDPLINYLNSVDRTGLDTENNSLNPLIAVHLLLQLGDKENPFVIDRTSIDNSFLADYQHLTFIGTNLQYDAAILDWNERHSFPTNKSIKIDNVVDLLVEEQIITRGSGLLNGLDAIHLRRLKLPLSTSKETRKEFIKMDKSSIFEDRHIVYAAEDIRILEDIQTVSNEIVELEHLHRRVYDIGFPLIPILKEMHLNGSALDKVTWEQILVENKAKRLELARKMDSTLIALGYKTKVRKQKELIVTDLFGNDSTIVNQNVKNINYSSDKQLYKIFNFFKQPKPQAKNKKTHLMGDSTGGDAINQYLIAFPDSILREWLKVLLDYKEVEKRINSFGIKFLKELYPDPKAPAGKNNLVRGFYNTYTGKVHTKYKQEFTANGRLSSGSDKTTEKSNKKKKSDVFFNSQQLPKENRYRNCFILEPTLIELGWWRTTIDLAGAELIILGSQSGDKKLLELQAADIHSHLGTASYTTIVKYIVNNMSERRAKDELYDLLKVNKIFEIEAVYEKIDGEDRFIRFYTDEEKHIMTLDRVNKAYLEKQWIVNKKTCKDIRDPFKNVVYGTAYGAQDARISETLNLPKDFAKLVVVALRQELPVAFKYLDTVADFAVRNGYLIFNNRTNSRHIFKEVMNAKQWGKELGFKQVGTVQRAAMNYSISGTQADMIKESMVVIDKYVSTHNIVTQGLIAEEIEKGMYEGLKKQDQFKWIFQIHDELVFDHKHKEFGAVAAGLMQDTANLYLDGIKMKADYQTLHYWNK